MTCFLAALKLGLTSFGGPVAHLGYFREAYVVQRKWLSDEKFSESLALCQFLPGPASSQLGALIGYQKGGLLGAVGSWLGFTLPSAVLMTLLAIGVQPLTAVLGDGWIHGLKLAAVAIVTLAVIGMKKKLCPTAAHLWVALVSLTVLVLAQVVSFGGGWIQPLVILVGGVVGAFFFSKSQSAKASELTTKFPRWSVVGIVLFVLSIVSLPLLGNAAAEGLLGAGSLVFGGGHVVLPLLETSFVDGGLMSQSGFLAGYGAAQAVPGPMFTLASYLGAATQIGGNAWLGGALGTLAIFAPGMALLVIGLPLWNWLKGMPRAQGAVAGANAAVVGLLAAALVHMLLAGVVSSALDLVIVVPIFLVLGTRKMPAWAAVLLAGAVGSWMY